MNVQGLAAGLAFVASCGGEPIPPITPTDGAQLDANVDAVVPIDAMVDGIPAPTGTIHVTVFEPVYQETSTGPAVGLPVVFTDALQTQVVMTDVDGVATASVTGPTSVTAVRNYGGFVAARAIIGAMPGDDLVLRRRVSDYSALAPLKVSFTPTDSPSYTACVPCKCATATASPISIPVPAYCAAASFDVLFFASPSSGAVYAQLPGVAYDPSQGGTASVTSTVAAPEFTSMFSNVPADVMALTPHRESGGLALGTVIANPPSTSIAHDRGGVGSAARRITTVLRQDSARQWVFEDVAPAATDYSLDLATTLLTWIDEPSFDVATHSLTANTSAVGSKGDLSVLLLAYGRPTGGSVLWEVFMPAAGTITLPTIPSSVADVSAASLGTHVITTFESAAVNGFDEARLDPHAIWNSDWALPRLTGMRVSQSPAF